MHLAAAAVACLEKSMTDIPSGLTPPAAEPQVRGKRDIRERMQKAVISHWEQAGTPDLSIFRIQNPDGSPMFGFKAGQYAQLAFWDQPARDPRPRQFSISSSPDTRDHLEFYAILVRNPLPGGGEELGVFTGTLWQHKIGDEILYMGPAGRFELDRTPQPEILCIATGTGLAPYIAMARQMWEQYRAGARPARRLTIIHGVSYSRELTYRRLLEDMAADPEFGLIYVPTISRPDQDPGWTSVLARGRANDILRLLYGHPMSGRVEPKVAEPLRELLTQRLDADRTAVYLCGNPDMIADCKDILSQHGYVTAGRESQVITEDYW